jgi:ATP-dependent Lon protease
MNDRSVVNKVLLDRLRVITTKGYSSREKRIIGDEYLLPKIMKEYGFDSLKISDDAWKYIMNGRSEPGVRNVKRDLETIISRLNIYRLCMRDKSFVAPVAAEASTSSSKGKDKEKESTRLKGIPTNISWKDGDALGEEDVKILLGNRDEGVDKPPPGMYA